MSLKPMQILISSKRRYKLLSLLRWTKEIDELTTKLSLLISTYPKLTVRAFLDNFRIWAWISLERIKISTSGKQYFQLRRAASRWALPHIFSLNFPFLSTKLFRRISTVVWQFSGTTGHFQNFYVCMYAVSRKKSLHFFLNNFNKCKFTFIIFGTHYHNHTLY